MADRAPPTDVSPLYLAAKSGQVALVRYILERGLNGVDERNDKVGSTVLMCAAKSGAIDVLKLLLQKGADPYLQNENGDTALMEAARAHNLEAIRVLAAAMKKEHIDQENELTSLTPFMYCVLSQRFEAAAALAKLGADKNFVN